MKIIEKLNGKNILIWGYGREGKSTESFINKYCKVNNLDILEGTEEDVDASRYDLVIKSPGISVNDYKNNFTSQTELFLDEFASQTIGITGTKGKSTTSAMLYTALGACLNQRVLLVGNLGFPCFDYYGEITDDTVIVFEMSCHQLSHIHRSPHIAVFLNLYEDHLDYYGTFEKYFEAKKNITSHQSLDDYFFCGSEVPDISTDAKKIIIDFATSRHFDIKLMGNHNQYNAHMVYEICTGIFGCSGNEVEDAIKTFKGLSHRLEHAGTIGGVDYYDDSISTIPEATIQALESVPHAKTVLIGGMDRNIHYDIIIDFVKNHPEYNYIFSYSSGKRIFEDVCNLEYCYYEENLKKAVNLAKKITPSGSACILSPAAASYGDFKNFEDRGDAFKNLVHEL